MMTSDLQRAPRKSVGLFRIFNKVLQKLWKTFRIICFIVSVFDGEILFVFGNQFLKRWMRAQKRIFLVRFKLMQHHCNDA